MNTPPAPSLPALNDSTFALGAFSVRRLGYGAMQLPGPNAFGPPRDHSTALAVLRRAVELGVNHIDTAGYYGPDIANALIREALHPYPQDLALVSKVGSRRDSDGAWLAVGPDQLRADIEANLRTLGVAQLALVNLRIKDSEDPGAVFDERLDVMIKARDDGLIGAIGLSNITREHLLRALDRTEIASVQNPYNLADRSSQPVLDECRDRNIAFVPFFPLGSATAPNNAVLGNPTVLSEATRLNRTPAQIALAWTLNIAPNVLLIPGTSSVTHLEENLAVADIVLADEARADIDVIGQI